MTTWTDLRQRLRAQLSDPNGSLFTDALLAEAARQTLIRLDAAAGGRGWTLAGLDDAPETTLPVLEQEMLLVGASAAAVSLRALSRAERFDLNETAILELTAWAERQAEKFTTALEAERRRYLHTAPTPPYGPSGWALND